jgi:hypothetical protein
MPELDPEKVRLGIDESEATTKTWKGAAQATEHQAPKSEVDQPALALAPGLPGPADVGADSSGATSPDSQMGPQAPTQPEPSAAPATPAPSTPAPSEPAPNQPAAEPQPKPQQLEPRQDQPVQPDIKQPLPQQPEPQQLQPQQPLPAPEGPSPVEVGPQQLDPQQLLAQQPEPLQEKDQQLKPVQPLDQQPKPVQDAQPQPKQDPSPPAPPQPQPQGAAGLAIKNAPGAKANSPDAQPGTKAEEESAAASVVESLTYHPGQPLAGKGLQVRTVNPRWGVTTMLTSSPKNTVIRVTFGRTGRVLKAAFTDTGTGYPDVDGPLLDAVYRWTATGEVLKKIPPSDPKDPRAPQQGLNFDIKLILEHGNLP